MSVLLLRAVTTLRRRFIDRLLRLNAFFEQDGLPLVGKRTHQYKTLRKVQTIRGQSAFGLGKPRLPLQIIHRMLVQDAIAL